MSNLPKATANDHPILAVLQLIQPANGDELFAEIGEVPSLAGIKRSILDGHLERLLKDGYIVETGSNRFIASPRAYFLIEKSLPAKKRDHARLLHLNRQRFL